MEPFPETLPPPLPDLLPADWQGAGAAPLEIDVGCHRGLFLVGMAQLYPTHNFLGIERQAERVERTKKKITRLGLTNAHVICGEGLETLQTLPDASVRCIHVLFPDPWPKRKHHLRRLVQTRFLELCTRLIQPGGLLRLVTDDASYAASMQRHAQGVPAFAPTKDDVREYPLTEFQKKFLTDQRPVHQLILVRK